MTGAGRSAGRRLELVAPDWIVQLVRLKPGAVPWWDAARMAVALPTPLAVGLAFGAAPLGLFGAMGALATSLADRGGPPRTRMARQAEAGLAGAVGALTGHLVAGSGWPAVPVVAAASLVAALLSVVNAGASVAALQLLVYVSISSGLPRSVPPQLLVSMYLCGAAWAMLLSALVALLTGTRTPERAAVANVYRAVADLLSATGDDHATRTTRQALTDALNTAYDAVLSVRSRSSGRNPVFRRLTALLNAATPVVEASVAIAHAGRRPPGEIPAAVRGLAEAITAERSPPPVPRALAGAESHRLRALRRGVDEVREQLVADEPGAAPMLPPTLRVRLVRMADRVLTGRSTWLYAVRLTLCMSLAEMLRMLLPFHRSYWVVLTVAIVLKPDFGSVFARAVQRGVGTLIGVLIGAGLLVLIPVGGALLPFVAAAAALLPIMRGRNYGMFAIFLTPLVALLLDLGNRQGPEIVLTRLVDTATGCALVLVVGYLLWPETWWVDLGPRVADAIDRLADYLRAAFGAEQTARARRRTAYRTMSDVRTSFQQKLAEPPPVSTRAAAWWPVIVQAERAVDAITEAAIAARAGGPRPAGDSVHLLVADLRDLSAALRQRRAPDELPVPEDPALATVAAEVRTARQIAAGPGSAADSFGHA